ncbi:Carbohydrate binding domain-containing protein [Andreprevotia lacus DSM 23236]|jgi:chitodextrinase|uniref:Carbohydrate binding domain-containing protein n=1 Tax=Andreprevotia lacus DSM 23236 TaxID=1121001 RepID=A0A1W1XNR9_9NEIS|nr:carbohydrate-binding protein [Andreprevotia lacus]SMC25495.1 Carbohydrate binding domain-containing protein [Andreprevotia lacus DSM 23236]
MFNRNTLLALIASMAATCAFAAPAWQPDVYYTAGTVVSYNGHDYRALVNQTDYSSTGWNPGNASLWTDLGPSSGVTTVPTATPVPTTPPTGGPTPTTAPTPTRAPTTPPTATPVPGTGCYATWNSSTAYNGGAQVSYNNRNYTAKWWTQNNIPSSSNGDGQPWTDNGPCGGTPSPTPIPTVTPTPGGPTPTPVPPGSRMYVGYSSTWNTSIYDLSTANIPNYFTHINLAFAKPDTAYVKGSYKFDQSVAGFEFVEGASTNAGQKTFTAQQAQDLRNIIAALKARGTQVWVSIGGWSYSQGSSWANFNAARVVDLVQDLGASGVDVDWETEGAQCNKGDASSFSCNTDGQIANIINTLYSEIHNRGANIGISVAGWSTGAYYVKGSPFEEGKVQWGSPFGGVMYSVVKNQGSKISHINLMSYDGGDYYDPREGYESYRAIYNGPINMGMEIAPEGAGGAVLKLNDGGVQYDADMLTGQNNMATAYYNVQTLVKYIKNKGKPNDGFMIWQIWKQRVHQPAPAGAATENTAGQFVCYNLPLVGNCSDVLPTLPKLTP